MKPSSGGVVAVIAVVGLTLFGAGCALPWTKKTSTQLTTTTTTVEKSSVANGVATATPSTPVATTTGEADTSDWITYREPALGFEMKMPKDWSGRTLMFPGEGDGPKVFLDQLGQAYFVSPISTTSAGVNLTIHINKESNMTLEDFSDAAGVGRRTEITLPNGMEAYYWGVPDKFGVNDNQLHATYALKSGDMFFYMDFSFSSKNKDVAQKTFKDWQEVLKSFKPIPLGAANPEHE